MKGMLLKGMLLKGMLLKSVPRHLPWLAAVSCVAAAVAAGAAWEGYAHARHPLALLGTTLAPAPGWFNAFGFVLPGLALAIAALARWSGMGAARWPLRIGMLLVAFSALAFAAQGMFPLDPERPDAGDSRLHALAWTLWWVAFVPGAALLATGGLRPRWLHALAAVGLPLAVLLVPALLQPAIAARLAFAGWFGWWLALSRGAASAPGSPPPGRR